MRAKYFAIQPIRAKRVSQSRRVSTYINCASIGRRWIGRRSIGLLLLAPALLLAGCDNSGGGANLAAASLIAARAHYQAAQWPSARRDIEAAIKADPRSSDAHFLAAEIAEKLGDLQAALSEYVSADATAPGTEPARVAAAALLIRAGAYQLAGEWIAKCLAERPHDTAIKAYRALLQQRLGDVRRATADAQAVVAENSGQAVANAVLAEQALRRRDPAGAMLKLEAGLATDPADRALLRLKAESLLQLRRADEAFEIYSALVQAEPASAGDRAALAELVAQTHGVAQGEEALRAGIALLPNDIDMRMQLVGFLARHRDSKAAMAELVTAIAAAPATTAFDIVLADTYAHDKRFDEATKTLRDAIARTGSDPAWAAAHEAAQLALARLQIARHDTATAGMTLEAVLKDRPNEDQALLVRGQWQLEQRKAVAAIADFLAVASRQPANPTVFASLAEAYLQNDQRREAIAALKRALSLMPSDAGLVARIVQLQSSFEEIQDARRVIDEFVERNSESVDGRAIQIRLAVQDKDWTAAELALAQLNNTSDAKPKAIALDAEFKEAQGRYREAAALYGTLLLADGQFDAPAARNFARTSIAAGQGAAGLDTLERLAEHVSSKDLVAYDLIRANLCDRVDRPERADALVEQAIRKDATAPAPYLQQASALARRNQVSAALSFIDHGIAAGAPQEPLLLARAELQNRIGPMESAILTYREILRVNPNSVVAANELANTLANQNPVDKVALRAARDALVNIAVVKNQAVLDTLAWSDYRLGELEAAKALLKLANAAQSANPQLRFHYGAVLMALGDNKGKKIVEDTLTDSYPGRTEAEKITISASRLP